MFLASFGPAGCLLRGLDGIEWQGPDGGSGTAGQDASAGDAAVPALDASPGADASAGDAAVPALDASPGADASAGDAALPEPDASPGADASAGDAALPEPDASPGADASAGDAALLELDASPGADASAGDAALPELDASPGADASAGDAALPEPDAGTCSGSAPYGDIGATWTSLKGAGGPLGCPLGPEKDHPEGNGARLQVFERGQISWSPKAGDHATLTAWLEGNRLVVDWSGTSPFNYDLFIVHWDKDGNNVGQLDLGGGSRTSGGWWTALSEAGTYRVVVEGCDETLLGHVCRQGWMAAVWVTYSPPG